MDQHSSACVAFGVEEMGGTIAIPGTPALSLYVSFTEDSLVIIIGHRSEQGYLVVPYCHMQRPEHDWESNIICAEPNHA